MLAGYYDFPLKYRLQSVAAMEIEKAPNHVQQLQQLAALLQKDKAESDSVTWVSKLVPIYVQKAVKAVLAPAGERVCWLPAVAVVLLHCTQNTLGPGLAAVQWLRHVARVPAEAQQELPRC